jgi:hypothetical protein
MRTIVAIAAFLAAGWLGALGDAAAQQSAKDQTEPRTVDQKAINQFLQLRDKREVLLSELPKLREELEALRFRQKDVARAQFDLEEAKKFFSLAKQERPPDQRKISFYGDRISEIEKFINGIKTEFPNGIDEAINKKEKEVRSKEQERAIVENRLNEILNVELANQRFKDSMSKWFAGLVAAVIVGFFFIAWLDEKVRQTIFSGQAGIQFVTLFSLVIAIILFGITGILEGKELSALLGGLSGYILGRATGHQTEPLGGK